MAHNGHTYLEIEHHDDGSGTLSYTHSDPARCLRHAVADLDAIHDSLEEYLREHEEEEEKEEEIHPGLHKELDKAE